MENRHGAAAMIDPADKQTKPLPLEEQKRGRGRPATGQAMTAAEKQRAYRKRLAEQQNNQVPAITVEKIRSTAAEHFEKLGQQLADAESQIRLVSRLLEQERENSERLANKVLELERQLKEAKKGNVTKTKKHRDDAPMVRINELHSGMRERIKDGMAHDDAVWRFVGGVEATLEQHGLTIAEPIYKGL